MADPPTADDATGSRSLGRNVVITRQLAPLGVLFLLLGVAGPAHGQSATPPAGGAPNGAINGEQIFAAMCGFCHLGGGRSSGKGPKLAGTDKSDSYLVNRIKNGKPGEMPAFGRAFTDEQIRAILAYIRGLKEQ